MKLDSTSYLLGCATPIALALAVYAALRYGPYVPYVMLYLKIFFSPSDRRALAANRIWERMQCGLDL